MSTTSMTITLEDVAGTAMTAARVGARRIEEAARADGLTEDRNASEPARLLNEAVVYLIQALSETVYVTQRARAQTVPLRLREAPDVEATVEYIEAVLTNEIKSKWL